MQELRHFPTYHLDGLMSKMLRMHIFKHMKFLQLVEDIVWLRQLYTILKLWGFYVNFIPLCNFQRSKSLFPFIAMI